jgi:hypothetical protein
MGPSKAQQEVINIWTNNYVFCGNRFPERFLDGKLTETSTNDGARHI